MATYLPELLSDILLCLPVKSLLRFRCLSTSLCSEIDSPDFVRNHLNRSIQRKIRQRLIIHNSFCNDFYCADFDGGLKEATILNKPYKTPIPGGYAVSGSCNGLILLVFPEFELLWNPFTRRFKKIPPCPVKIDPCYRQINMFGLGYDSALDDYKLVLIPAFYRGSQQAGDYWQVWIFSLKSNSWRRDLVTPPDLVPIFSQKASFANGFLYWHCDNGEVIAFDLENELFFKIPLFPNSGILRLDNTSGCFRNEPIGVLGGNLYATIPAEAKTTEFYLLVRHKVGEEAGVCWKKAFAVDEEMFISNCLVLPRPLAHSKDGESILIYRQNEFFWYNLENEQSQKVQIAGIPRAGYRWPDFHVCWESLVSLGNESVGETSSLAGRCNW